MPIDEIFSRSLLCLRACECTSTRTHAPTPASCPSEGNSGIETWLRVFPYITLQQIGLEVTRRPGLDNSIIPGEPIEEETVLLVGFLSLEPPVISSNVMIGYVRIQKTSGLVYLSIYFLSNMAFMGIYA